MFKYTDVQIMSTEFRRLVIVVIGILVLILLLAGIYFFVYVIVRSWTLIVSLYRYINAEIRGEFEPEDLDPQPTPMFNLTLNNPLDPWIYRFRGVEVPDPYARVYFVNQDIKNDQDDNDYKELSEV